MAIGEQQTQVDEEISEEGDAISHDVGWRHTLGKIKADTTARLGM